MDELRTLRKTNADKIDWFPKLQRANMNTSSLFVTPSLQYNQAGPYFGRASRY